MKVDEMKMQRQRFGEQFREQVHTDDITNVLVTRDEVNQEVGVRVYIINAVWHLINNYYYLFIIIYIFKVSKLFI